jgi:hypothetical protein
MTRTKNLARFTPARFEQFLIELTNLNMNGPAVSRFVRRFADFELFNEQMFSALFNKPVPTGLPTSPIYPLVYSEEDDDPVHRVVIPYMRALFRATWVEPNRRTREWAWAIFRSELAGRWAHGGNDYLYLWNSNIRWLGEDTQTVKLPEPPPPVPYEGAFDYLLAHHNLARYCQNPNCPAPYFFAIRHTQRYCCEKCAQGGEKESKRRWWAEHGPEWRKRNLKKRKKTSSKGVARKVKGK